MKLRSRFTIGLGALLGSLFFLWLWLDNGPHDRVPNPNGYNDFVQAAQGIQGYHGNYQDLGREQSAQFVAANQLSLEMVRRGLEKECRIPIESTSAWFVTHQSELGQLKMLVHTIITEGKVADSQGQIDRALDTYLDGLKFSYHAVRGGLGYDYLCGVSFKALFLKAIKDLAPKLTPEQSLRALHALDKLELEQEPLKVIARRSKAWRRKTSGPGDLLNQLAAMVKTWSLNPELRNLMRASGTLEQQSNRLRTTLAHSAGASGEESPARRAD